MDLGFKVYYLYIFIKFLNTYIYIYYTEFDPELLGYVEPVLFMLETLFLYLENPLDLVTKSVTS